MRTRSSETGTTHEGGRISLITHLILVGLVATYVGVSLAAGAVGANIGLAFGLMAAGLLAMPWTLLILLDDRFTVDSVPFIALVSAGTIINLVLHALVWARLSPRRP